MEVLVTLGQYLQVITQQEEFREMTKQKTTLVNFILDETGSMGNVLDQTITGFNEYVDTLRASEQPMVMSLVKFNSNGIKTVFENTNISEVPELTGKNYCPAAMTPLIDAVGQTIHQIDERLLILKGQKKALPLILCVVLTDGFENASTEYTRSQIFDMVQERERQGWTFVFLGADQDAWNTSQYLGFSLGNTMSYDSTNTNDMYRNLATITVAYVTTGEKTNSFFNDK